ncbi:LysR family transcriptional regulator [Paracidovorax citrulli]
MKLSELALFRAIHQCATLTAAAESVGISQPAASALLRQMEERLGFALFIRERKRMVLTDNARVLLPEVLNALAGLDSVERLGSQLRDGVTTRVVVGAVSTVANSLLPRAIARVQAQSEDLSIVVRAGTTMEIAEMAAQQRIDFGVVLGTAQRARVQSMHLGDLDLCCVMRRDHPLARRKRIALPDLQAQRLILLSPHQHVGEVFYRVARQAGLTLHPVVEVMQSAAACALVEAGAGIAVLESLSAIPARRQDLLAVPLQVPEGLVLTLVWSGNRDLSAPARALIGELEADSGQLRLSGGSAKRARVQR